MPWDAAAVNAANHTEHFIKDDVKRHLLSQKCSKPPDECTNDCLGIDSNFPSKDPELFWYLWDTKLHLKVALSLFHISTFLWDFLLPLPG
jgi:hypothetical protein